MRAIDMLKAGLPAAVLALAALAPARPVSAGEEQRAPPQARTAGTLGPQVMRAIAEIQELMSPEDPDDQPDLARAKEELDQLRARRWERMNDFEKSTLLSFYSNYYLGTEDYLGAIGVFEEILQIENLREDQRLRTLRSLGQLYAAEERWQDSIDNYTIWRNLSLEEDAIVFKGLSFAHNQLEQNEQALPYWLDYMDMMLLQGQELVRQDYAYLQGLYFILERFEDALELTKSMIVLFDDSRDWLNLVAVYGSLDREERRVQSLNLAYLAGHVDDENRYMNLGQSLAGQDVPLNGAKIIEEGLELEIIEPVEDNLTIATQMHLIASTFADGLPLAERLAEVSEGGDGYDTVGYIHYILNDYEAAARAFQDALDKGGLDSRSDTLLFLARSLLELDDFEGARAAARQAADAGDEDEREAASDYLRFIANTERRYNIIEERKADSIDYYEPYPPISI